MDFVFVAPEIIVNSPRLNWWTYIPIASMKQIYLKMKFSAHNWQLNKGDVSEDSIKLLLQVTIHYWFSLG